jgi:glycosyltransferase involved in cell wall biosynthesis
MGELESVITANPSFYYRRYPELVGRVTYTSPYYLPGLALGRLPGLKGISRELDWWASRSFDRAAAKKLVSSSVLIAWAWSAAHSFKTARERGIKCVVEECGSAQFHQEKILSDEYERFGLKYRNQIAARVIANERRECELADAILCPSEYVANSFNVYGVPRSRCIVLPYAMNPRFRASSPKPAKGMLEVLYVGSVGFRKGLLYLLDALRLLDDPRIRCTVIGRIDPDITAFLDPYRSFFRHIPWVSHEELPQYFRAASVFVLPSLDEGMAYVVMEALASGTPVITTPHSGAEGVLRHGKNGLLVPIRDAEAIAVALNSCVEDPDRVTMLSIEALKTATSWTWDDYASSLLKALAS